jgi:hypothetical protein
VLEIDEPSAEVVRRIFWAYVDGNGDRAIATILNEEGVPCPSARWPEQNRHRQADGWQGSTVRAIIDNPRYTGYAVFGWWARREMLLNPDDVAAGHVIRFRWVAPNRIVRSREPAPRRSSRSSCSPRRSCSAGPRTPGDWRPRGRPSAARGRRTYVLRGMVRCGVCHRRMAGEMVRKNVFYRCASRTMAPGSTALADHPATVNLREDVLASAVNGWIGELFLPENVDRTVAELVGAQAPGRSTAVWKR